jgi:AcrR family transcriptional regulator
LYRDGVPRVSEDHLTARRRQIVEAALRCFAREGFHRTSMRDVIRESGLSAGAVYSYFPSKGELIAAAVEPVLGQLRAALDEVLAAPEPVAPTTVAGLLLERVVPVITAGEVDLTRVAVTAWGEALRDPDVGALAGRAYGDVRGRLTEAVLRWRDAGHLDPGADVAALGSVVFSVVAGYVLQHALLGDVDPSRYAAAAASLQVGRG